MTDQEFSRPNDGDNEPYEEEPYTGMPADLAASLKDIEFDDEHLIAKIRIAASTIAPDRTQYKPYSPSYNFPYHVRVEVTVPYSMVASYNKEEEWIVLKPEGIAYIADQLATALDKMHDEFRNKDRRI